MSRAMSAAAVALAFLAALQCAHAVSYEGADSFINSFTSSAPISLPGAELRLVTGGSIFGLDLAKMSALYFKLDPCTILQPHIHPHDEFAYTISGKVTHSIPYNNGTLTGVISNTKSAPSSSMGFAVFPEGQLHVTQNEGCTPAEVISVFNKKIPDLYFFPYTTGFLPSNTIKSYFNGMENAAGLKSPVGTATLAGCKC